MRQVSLRSVLPALVLILGISTRASGGDLTYDLVNYPAAQNGYTLSGSITTDGTIGILTPSDITAWTVTISSPTTSETFSSSDPGSATGIQSNLIATSSEIYLPPSSDGADILELIGPGNDQIIFDNYNEYTAIISSGRVWYSGNPVAGDWTIATASVPEPSTFAMLGIAAVCVCGYSRRRVVPAKML
jgi:hypothetical protein